MLYPLSYEGGDGAERGAKLGATARKPWEKGSSGSIGRSKVQLDLTEVSSAVWAGVLGALRGVVAGSVVDCTRRFLRAD